MIVSFSIIRYHKALIPFALLAMAMHRLAMRRQKGCSFWRLLGSGKGGTFSIKPDWQQWGLLAVWDTRDDFNRFYASSSVTKWWDRFACEKWTIICRPMQSHGKWDGTEPFGKVNQTIGNCPVAILTRATIRLKRLKNFWAHVESTSALMKRSPGYIMSVGVGELPVYRQATFSIWQNIEVVKAFAYGSKEHAEVIRKTREENWYNEELFARFEIIESMGSINGNDPLKGIYI